MQDHRKFYEQTISTTVLTFVIFRNKLRIKTGGNGKAIDFYAGLRLDQGPLNPNRKTWVQAVKEERLREEQENVSSLKDWERGTLREVDP